ncbi:ABC transporter substrate-binding protein [Paenibacillus sp. GCM10023252]|uniref:ABC transporter substrate-binding protein n=1 Tax=Paenibacillus sp. GCM10023252 TaxID=3252649 RepID=UPI003615AD61
MMKKSKMVLAIVMALMIVLAGCSGNNSSSSKNNEGAATNAPDNSSEESAAEPVKLKWYYVQFGLPADQETVEAEMNKITKEKLNTEVDLIPVDGSEYEQKMNTIVAAGEVFDLVWTSNWSFKYIDNVNKGALLDITDLLEKNAPKVKSTYSDLAWDDTRVNGKIYGVPNYQTFTKSPGFVIQKRFVDKYSLDVSKIKSYADLEPFLEQIKKNEKDIIPFGADKGFSALHEVYGMGITGGVIYRQDAPLTVVESGFPEEKQFLDLMRKWYQAGYINKDAATTANLDDKLSKGNIAVVQDFTLKPGGEAEAMNKNGGNEVVFVRIADPTFTGVTATMNAISKTSKHPDRALQLLELVNTDPALFNLLKFGIEGKHYTKVNDTTVKIIADSGYTSASGWIFGNETIGYLMEGQAADTWEVTKNLNDTATAPLLAGFNFNNEKVKTENAATSAILQEYSSGLNTGSIDPAKYYPIMLERLDKAGYEAVRKEKQRQIDEWAAANGKK